MQLRVHYFNSELQKSKKCSFLLQVLFLNSTILFACTTQANEPKVCCIISLTIKTKSRQLIEKRCINNIEIAVLIILNT